MRNYDSLSASSLQGNSFQTPHGIWNKIRRSIETGPLQTSRFFRDKAKGEYASQIKSLPTLWPSHVIRQLDESICRFLCWRRSKPSVFNLPVPVFVKVKKKAGMRKQNEEHSVFSLFVSHDFVLFLPFRFFISRQNLGNGNLVLLLIYWHQIKNALFQVQVCQFIGQSLTFSSFFYSLSLLAYPKTKGIKTKFVPRVKLNHIILYVPIYLQFF